MKRFQRFIGSSVIRERFGATKVLEDAGLDARYLPDEFDDFDEMEFLAPFEGDKKMVFSVVLEEKKIKRMSLGWVGPEDPDDAMRGLDDDEIQRALELRGEAFVRLLDEVTEQ